MGRLLVLAFAALLSTLSVTKVIYASQYVLGERSVPTYNPYLRSAQPAYNSNTVGKRVSYLVGGGLQTSNSGALVSKPSSGNYIVGRQAINPAAFVSKPTSGNYIVGRQATNSGVSVSNPLSGSYLVGRGKQPSNAGPAVSKPISGSYVYSRNILPSAANRVVIVSDFDPFAAKNLKMSPQEGDFEVAVGGNEKAPGDLHRQRRATPKSCEFVANSQLNAVVKSSNLLTLDDALVLIVSTLSTPFSVSRVMANTTKLAALGQRTNLFIATVPTQKARTPAELAAIEDANDAILALAKDEQDVHVIDYATKVSAVRRLGTTLDTAAMCAWVTAQVGKVISTSKAMNTAAISSSSSSNSTSSNRVNSTAVLEF